MEKKTIGGFICALRKASGMTQKQLADKLMVSDKSVSRWERDECMPDLTLIPAIADIFGVTADELLRGERKNIESQETKGDDALSQRSQKQISILQKRVETSYKIKSIISCAVALAGLVTQIIFNFNPWGLVISAVFAIAAVTMQTVFCIGSFSSVDSEDFSGAFESGLGKQLFITSAASLSFVGTCLLIIASGIFADMFGYQLTAQLGAIVICAILCPLFSWIAKIRIVKSGKYFMEEDKKEKYLKVTKLKKNTLAKFSAIFAVVLAAHLILISLSGTICSSFSKKEVFTSAEQFIAYAKQPLDMAGDEYFVDDDDDAANSAMVSIDGKDVEVPIYNDNIRDYDIHYTDDGKNVESVVVTTFTGYSKVEQVMVIIYILFFCAYAVLIIAFIVTFVKKKRAVMKGN